MSKLIERIERDDQKYLRGALKLADAHYAQESTEDRPIKVRPINLETRIMTAAILSSQYLTGANRKAITALIRTLSRGIPGDHFAMTDIERELVDFENKERDLFDVFKEVLQQINTLELYEHPEVIAVVTEINQLIYDALKAILEGDLRADALTSVDEVNDETRNDEFPVAANAMLEKIHEVLSVIAKLKGVRLIYANPNPKPDDEEAVLGKFQCFNYPQGDQPNKFDINPYANVKWEPYNDKDLNVDYVILPTQEGCRLTFKLCFGDDEFGYLEYELEGSDVHPLIFSKGACISAMVDTFLNTRLQNEVKRLISEKKREIFKEYDFRQWPTICTELCKYLSKILDRPLAFTCKRSPYDNESYSVLVDGDNANENADLVEFTQQTLAQNGDIHDLIIDMGNGNLKIGKVVVTANDETRKGIINDALSFFESVLMAREGKRTDISGNVGSLFIDLWLEDNAEEEPQRHDVTVLYADIDEFTSNLEKQAAVGKDHIMGKIMGQFFGKSKLELERKYKITVDKVVGDQIIILIGPPFTKDGIDAFGNKQADFVNQIELAHFLQVKIQALLTRICREICEEENYPFVDLKFGFGCGIAKNNLVGIFGDIVTPGAGADYTIIGSDMNKIARVASRADADEFLMPYDSFLEYQELDGKELIVDEEPFNIDAKGIGDTMVVKIKKK